MIRKYRYQSSAVSKNTVVIRKAKHAFVFTCTLHCGNRWAAVIKSSSYDCKYVVSNVLIEQVVQGPGVKTGGIERSTALYCGGTWLIREYQLEGTFWWFFHFYPCIFQSNRSGKRFVFMVTCNEWNLTKVIPDGLETKHVTNELGELVRCLVLKLCQKIRLYGNL